MSTKNPFRTPGVSPNPTGASASSSQPPRIPSPPLPNPPTPSPPPTPIATSPASFQPPQGPPPGFQSPANTGSGSGGGVIEADDLNAEAPPAYTPAADPYQGESTLELGPRRPFQPQQHQPPPQQQFSPPPHPPYNPPYQPYLSPRGTGWSQNSGPPQGQWSNSNPSLHHPTPPGGNGWSAYPGQAHSQTSSNLPPPPPRHPHSRSNTELVSPPGPSSLSAPGTVSDFAREFYAAGAGDDAGQASASGGGSGNTWAPPPGPPPKSAPGGNQYAPPPGAPPSSSGAGGSGNANGVPDDGSPTKSPIPGHPLLLNGKLLVYPGSYECHKCNNTGFKNFDPSHPCSKCWDRYSRPYVGAITYTPWSSQNSNSSTSSSSRSKTNFQRPLPLFKPPHLSRAATSQTHSRTTSNPSAPLARAQTQTQAHHPQHGYAPPANPPPNIHVASRGYPPPGSTVVPPGDPRIGGRMCFKCDGRGVVPFLIFEEITCVICGGVGRVF